MADVPRAQLQRSCAGRESARTDRPSIPGSKDTSLPTLQRLDAIGERIVTSFSNSGASSLRRVGRGDVPPEVEFLREGQHLLQGGRIAGDLNHAGFDLVL